MRWRRRHRTQIIQCCEYFKTIIWLNLYEIVALYRIRRDTQLNVQEIAIKL